MHIQLHLVAYCKDLKKELGKVLEHDNTDSERAKGKKLDTGFSVTTKQWEGTFGSRYWRAASMYRGIAPTPVTVVPCFSDTLSQETAPSADFCKILQLPEVKFVKNKEGLVDLFGKVLVEKADFGPPAFEPQLIQDLHFFVTGGEDENELILATVLQRLFDVVGLLLRLSIRNTNFKGAVLEPILQVQKRNLREELEERERLLSQLSTTTLILIVDNNFKFYSQ